MITPSYGLTATERVLPRLALDWTTGLAQLGVDVTRAGVATFVGSNGLIQSATADTQRVDYLTGVAGLLVEESRTNLITDSNNFNTGWTKVNCTVSTDATTSPDGTLNADLFVSSSGFPVALRRTISVTTSNVFTLSVFGKVTDPARTIELVLASNTNLTTNRNRIYVDLSTGTVTDSINVTSSSVKLYANGFYRASMTFTPVFTGTAYYGITSANDTSVGDVAFLYGAQLEAGAFPTSYIPTEATAVTRNADLASMTGTNFSDWFNATEGTFAITAIRDSSPAAGKFPYSLFLTSTSGNDINLYQNGATSEQGLIRVSGGTQANLNSTVVPANTKFTQSVGYKLNSFAQSVNAGALALDALGTVPTLTEMQIGSAGGGFQLNGRVQKVNYWPQRLTDAEVTAFSK
jgi:hypothetical protein